MLAPATVYTIAVARAARGEDQQFLAASVALHFTTGARVENAHAVVLAGQQGEGSTEVLLPALAAAVPGEPIAAPVLLKAPRCTTTGGCGTVAAQAPLQTYTSAAVSPDGSYIAVVMHDALASASLLEVIDTINGVVVDDIANATLPSWSPDGAQLAMATPAGVGGLRRALGHALDRRGGDRPSSRHRCGRAPPRSCSARRPAPPVTPRRRGRRPSSW